MAILPTEQVIINVTQTIALSPDNFLRRFAIVSDGDTTLASGISQEVFLSTIDTVFNTGTEDYKDTYTYKWLISYFGQNNAGSAIVLETTGADVPAAVANLATYITTANKRVYKYSVPNTFYNEATFATLVGTYTGLALSSSQYFSSEINTTPLPSVDPIFAAFKDKRNYMGFFPSPTITEAVDGAITGILASPVYNVSATNLFTQVSNKLCNNITPNDTLPKATYIDLAENNVIWVQTVATQVVVAGGTYLDNTGWEYYYSSDLLQFNMENAVQQALINGANNPLQRIAYDNAGVLTLKSVIEGSVRNLVAAGGATDFGTGLDVNNVIVGSGEINYIPYAIYRRDNYVNYTEGKYDAYSLAIDITRFILQVTINIQLN